MSIACNKCIKLNWEKPKYGTKISPNSDQQVAITWPIKESNTNLSYFKLVPSLWKHSFLITISTRQEPAHLWPASNQLRTQVTWPLVHFC